MRRRKKEERGKRKERETVIQSLQGRRRDPVDNIGNNSFP